MTTPRLRIGPYGDGTVGLKTSPDGFDVTVLSDDNDGDKRSFNSQWSNLTKVKLVGAITLPAATGTYSVAHGLGYEAFFDLHVWNSPTVGDDGWLTFLGSSMNRIGMAYINSSNLNFVISNTNYNWTAGYIIWKVPS